MSNPIAILLRFALATCFWSIGLRHVAGDPEQNWKLEVPSLHAIPDPSTQAVAEFHASVVSRSTDN